MRLFILALLYACFPLLGQAQSSQSYTFSFTQDDFETRSGRDTGDYATFDVPILTDEVLQRGSVSVDYISTEVGEAFRRWRPLPWSFDSSGDLVVFGYYYTNGVLTLEKTITNTARLGFKQFDNGNIKVTTLLPETTTSKAPAPELNTFRLSAYPQPASGEITLELDVDHPQQVDVRAYDAGGREVARLFSGFVSARQTITLDGSTLSSGAYLVRAAGERTLARQMITIIH